MSERESSPNFGFDSKKCEETTTRKLKKLNSLVIFWEKQFFSGGYLKEFDNYNKTYNEFKNFQKVQEAIASIVTIGSKNRSKTLSTTVFGSTVVQITAVFSCRVAKSTKSKENYFFL